MTVSDDELDRLSKCLQDKFWRLNNLYWIKDKQGKEVLFQMNEAQLEYFRNKHNKNLIPKSRQLGFTTLEVLDGLDSCLFIDNFDYGIIAHTVDDAEKIFTNKVNFAFDRLPEFIREARRPNTDRAGELRFPNGSSISVSAGFRGGTLRKLLVSEFAKICAKYPEKAREIVTGALNAVPLDGEATIESTGEGMNGYFFEMCEAAIGKEDLTPLDFKIHFFPWWKAKEYRLNPAGISISQENEAYFARLEDGGIKLDAHQKAWYEKKSQEQGDDIRREFPSTYEEVFSASGRPVFSQDQLAADIRKAKERPFKIKVFEVKRPERVYSYRVKIFEEPKPNEAYAVGADVAEGLEDGDSSTAAVYGKDYQMKAAYEGKLDPDIFGDLLVEIGTYFNMALLTPELNNHGHATVAAIKRHHYPHVYRRVQTEEVSDEIQDKIGWLNTVKTKAKMLDDLLASYRDKSLKIWCEHTLRQMRTITYEEDGGVVLNSKDLVVATGLAIQGLAQAVASNKLGVHDTARPKTTFKTLEEMLEASEAEESYFD
jgi:hypothetical protein